MSLTSRDSWTFADFRQIPRPSTFIFTCPSNQLRPIFTIFLRYINHPEEIARIVPSSTFSFEEVARELARLHNLSSYVTRSRVYDKAKDRYFFFLFPFLPPPPSLSLQRRLLTRDGQFERGPRSRNRVRLIRHNCRIPR